MDAIHPQHAIFSTQTGRFPPRGARTDPIVLRSSPEDDRDSMVDRLRQMFPSQCKSITAPIGSIYHYFDESDAHRHGYGFLESVLLTIAFLNSQRARRVHEFAEQWLSANPRYFEIHERQKKMVFTDAEVEEHGHEFLSEVITVLQERRPNVSLQSEFVDSSLITDISSVQCNRSAESTEPYSTKFQSSLEKTSNDLRRRSSWQEGQRYPEEASQPQVRSDRRPFMNMISPSRKKQPSRRKGNFRTDPETYTTHRPEPGGGARAIVAVPSQGMLGPNAITMQGFNPVEVTNTIARNPRKASTDDARVLEIQEIGQTKSQLSSSVVSPNYQRQGEAFEAYNYGAEPRYSVYSLPIPTSAPNQPITYQWRYDPLAPFGYYAGYRWGQHHIPQQAPNQVRGSGRKASLQGPFENISFPRRLPDKTRPVRQDETQSYQTFNSGHIRKFDKFSGLTQQGQQRIGGMSSSFEGNYIQTPIHHNAISDEHGLLMSHISSSTPVASSSRRASNGQNQTWKRESEVEENRLWVGNLPLETSQPSIKRLFEPFGYVTEVSGVQTSSSKPGKGSYVKRTYAFVRCVGILFGVNDRANISIYRFQNAADATKAIQGLDLTRYGGVTLHVRHAIKHPRHKYPNTSDPGQNSSLATGVNGYETQSEQRSGYQLNSIIPTDQQRSNTPPADFCPSLSPAEVMVSTSYDESSNPETKSLNMTQETPASNEKWLPLLSRNDHQPASKFVATNDSPEDKLKSLGGDAALNRVEMQNLEPNQAANAKSEAQIELNGSEQEHDEDYQEKLGSQLLTCNDTDVTLKSQENQIDQEQRNLETACHTESRSTSQSLPGFVCKNTTELTSPPHTENSTINFVNTQLHRKNPLSPRLEAQVKVDVVNDIEDGVARCQDLKLSTLDCSKATVSNVENQAHECQEHPGVLRMTSENSSPNLPAMDLTRRTRHGAPLNHETLPSYSIEPYSLNQSPSSSLDNRDQSEIPQSSAKIRERRMKKRNIQNSTHLSNSKVQLLEKSSIVSCEANRTSCTQSFAEEHTDSLQPVVNGGNLIERRSSEIIPGHNRVLEKRSPTDDTYCGNLETRSGTSNEVLSPKESAPLGLTISRASEPVDEANAASVALRPIITHKKKQKIFAPSKTSSNGCIFALKPSLQLQKAETLAQNPSEILEVPTFHQPTIDQTMNKDELKIIDSSNKVTEPLLEHGNSFSKEEVKISDPNPSSKSSQRPKASKTKNKHLKRKAKKRPKEKSKDDFLEEREPALKPPCAMAEGNSQEASLSTQTFSSVHTESTQPYPIVTDLTNFGKGEERTSSDEMECRRKILRLFQALQDSGNQNRVEEFFSSNVSNPS